MAALRYRLPPRVSNSLVEAERSDDGPLFVCLLWWRQDSPGEPQEETDLTGKDEPVKPREREREGEREREREREKTWLTLKRPRGVMNELSLVQFIGWKT